MYYIIVGNFGNHSLAALQYLIEKNVTPLHFVYVTTGWEAVAWPERILACSAYAQNKGVTVHQLSPPANFTALVSDRKQFPSRKFQWCASFLKGLPIIEYLDEFDPGCEACIVSGKRQYDSRRYSDLPEFEYDNHLYQGRTVWHPLWQTTNEAFSHLIGRAGFSVLPHQSLECSPCIHTKLEELATLDSNAVERLDRLEQRIEQSMFQQPIKHFYGVFEKVDAAAKTLDLQSFDLSCGAAWGCGE